MAGSVTVAAGEYSAKVLADPEDLDARLGYADAIERADPEHAALIRHQIRSEYASLPYCATPPGEARWLDGLTRLVAPRVAAPVAPLVADWALRCGFVETVTMAAVDFLAHGAELFERAPIRTVRLTDVTGHVGALARSPLLACLAGLDLAGNTLGDTGVATLAGSTQLTRLRCLGLANCGVGRRGAEALAASGNLPSLRWLDFAGNAVELAAHLVRNDYVDEPSVHRPAVNRELTRRYGDRPWLLWPLPDDPLPQHAGPCTRTLELSRPGADLPEPGKAGRLTDGELVAVMLTGAMGAWPEYADRIARKHPVQAELIRQRVAQRQAWLAGRRWLPSPGQRIAVPGAAVNEVIAAVADHMVSWWSFGHGLVETLNLSARDFLDRGPQLLRQTPLRLVKVPGANNVRLRQPPIRYLTLTGAADVIDAVAASPLLAELRGLDVSANRLGDRGVLALLGSPHLTRAWFLGLSSTDAGPAAITAILNGHTPPSLRYIGCHGNPGAPERPVLSQAGAVVDPAHPALHYDLLPRPDL